MSRGGSLFCGSRQSRISCCGEAVKRETCKVTSAEFRDFGVPRFCCAGERAAHTRVSRLQSRPFDLVHLEVKYGQGQRSLAKPILRSTERDRVESPEKHSQAFRSPSPNFRLCCDFRPLISAPLQDDDERHGHAFPHACADLVVKAAAEHGRALCI